MKNFLTAQEVIILQEAHHSSRLRKSAYRIKTILCLNQGLPYEQIAKLLLLDETTVRRYYKEYQKTGVDGLLEDHYCGSNGYLTILQEQELTAHLKIHTYQTVKEVILYAFNTYNKNYSIESMTHLLHRLGFVYKKTKVIPGKVDREKQEEFKQAYYHLKQTKKPEDKIYFVDATHPQHNNMPFYGWIYKGEEKTIETNSGRTRLNLNGALSLEDMAITVLSEETINTHAMMRLVLNLEEKQETGEIYLIIDNASYYKNKDVKAYLEKSYCRIKLIFLPTYSPNLNFIEKLWKFLKKYIIGVKYRDKFKQFEYDVHQFFDHIDQYEEKLKQFIGTEMHLVKLTA